MPCIHQSDAVRTNQRSTVLIDSFQYTFFQQCPFVSLFTKSGREYDKRPRLLFTCQCLYNVRTHNSRNSQHRQIGIRQFFYVCKSRNSLHFCLLRIHCPKLSLITSVYQIFQYSATRLMYIIRSPYYNYAFGTKQLGCYHIIHWFTFN